MDPVVSDTATAIVTGGFTLCAALVTGAAVWVKRRNGGGRAPSLREDPELKLHLCQLVELGKEGVAVSRRTNELLVQSNAQHDGMKDTLTRIERGAPQ